MGLRSRSCLLLLLLLVFVVPAALAACTNTDPCVGQPDCSGCALGDSVPDPTNCSQYYLCDATENIYSQVLNCDPGAVFDITSRACVPDGTCTVCPPVCYYDCSIGAGDFISSHDDCQTYYECPYGYPLRCDDSTPFYDGISCQTDEARCCRCLPYCYGAGYLLADPLDCRRFYVCIAVGTPTQWGDCSSGQYFDSSIHACSASASCVTQCPNVLDEDGCIDHLTCLSTGYFAGCPNQCQADYYYCPEVTDEYPDVQSCGSEYVFHPDSHTCVTEDQCP